ncbi:ABC transporter permease [Oricola sp.]|uniref:ABC transporter permease n=1 Tax=Oricola sp. TaxID=1979950 RepID=UPI003BABDBAD
MREALALTFLLALAVLYFSTHPRGLSTYVLTIWANQSTILALAACAQFFAVVVRGLDLSVGAVMALSNCLASHLVNGSEVQVAAALAIVLLAGMACGAINGLIIVRGRVQPIVATLATAAVFGGMALLLRPTPGGEISMSLSDAMTYDLFGFPTSLVLIAAILALVWVPLRRTGFGIALYAVGSNEQSAYHSGVDSGRVKLAAYTLSGLFASAGGLFVGFVTLTGDAGIAPSYTLLSIAAVVLGGVLLRGGVGTILGAIAGAFTLRTISALMFFSGIPPLAQPLIEGLVLAAAVGIGGADVFRLRNKLEVFDR